MIELRRSAFTSIVTLSLATVAGCAEGVDPSNGSAPATGAGGATSTGGVVGTGSTTTGTGAVTGVGGSNAGTGGTITTAGGTSGTSGAGGTNPSTGGGAGTSAGGQQGAVDAGPPAIGVIVAQHEANGGATDNNIVIHVRLENRSTRTIPVSALTMRYWYTIDAPAPSTTDYQVMELNYADITRLSSDTHVKFSFAKMAKPQTGADHYIEIGFTGSYALAPEPNPPAHDNNIGSTNQIEFRTHWPDFKNYNQANDYSYEPAMTSYADSHKITVYQNGVLIWGTEPDGTKPKAPSDGGTGDGGATTDGATDGAGPPADAGRG